MWFVTLLGAACQGGNSTDMGTGLDPGAGQDLARSGGDGSLGQADLAPPDAGRTTGPINGTSIGIYLSAQGEVRKPDDAAHLGVQALSGGSGAVMAYPAKGGADGSFTIDKVPDGPFWLQVGSDRFLWTQRRDVNLNHYHPGRPDPKLAATSPTTVVFSLSGLAPWQDADDIQFTAANLNLNESPLSYTDTLPNIGDMTLGMASLDWSQISAPYLIDGAKGDAVILGQLEAAVTAMGVPFLALTRSLAVPSFTQVDGGKTTVAGALVNTAPGGNFQAIWKRSRFESLLLNVNPSATSYSQDASLSANPAGPDHGEIGQSPDLLRIQPTPGITDLDLGTLSYRNPFPAVWPLHGKFSHTFIIAYALTGADNKASLLGSIGVAQPAEQFSNGVGPLIGPVGHPRIGGKDAFAGGTGIGVTPDLSWDAPAIGVLTGTTVIVYRIELPAGQRYPRTVKVATLITTGLTVTTPPGLLVAGKTYVFQFRALSQPGLDLSWTPFQDRLPKGYADALSGIFSP